MHLPALLSVILWTTVSGQSPNGCPDRNTYTLFNYICYLDPKVSAMNYIDAGKYCYNNHGAYLPTVFNAFSNSYVNSLANKKPTWLGLNSENINGTFQWDMPDPNNSTFTNGAMSPDNGKFVYMDIDGSWKQAGDNKIANVICSVPQDIMSCDGTGLGQYEGIGNSVTNKCYRVTNSRHADRNSATNYCKTWTKCGNLVKISSAALGKVSTTLPWVWIGLESKNGKLVWHDGTPLGNGYNNLVSGSPANGTCVAMNLSRNALGTWGYMDCGTQLKYVCQSKPSCM